MPGAGAVRHITSGNCLSKLIVGWVPALWGAFTRCTLAIQKLFLGETAMKLLLTASVCMLAFSNFTLAADVKVLSPVALKPVFEKVGPEFERTTGNKLVLIGGESGGIRADIEKGTSFDVAFLTLGFVDELIKQGKLDGATKATIARSGIGIAIRKGAPKPDVSTTDAFKRTLLAAKSIGFVEHSASSRYLATLLKRLDLTDALKDKLKPLSGPAGPFVGAGDPEIAITQMAAIQPSDGVELAGPLPPEVQLYTIFAAAARPNSDPAANAFLKAMISPAAVTALKESGLDLPL
jgi:molybdate transport system substrate-binding protein